MRVYETHCVVVRTTASGFFFNGNRDFFTEYFKMKAQANTATTTRLLLIVFGILVLIQGVPAQTPCNLPGDINGDFVVDLDDLYILSENWLNRIIPEFTEHPNNPLLHSSSIAPVRLFKLSDSEYRLWFLEYTSTGSNLVDYNADLMISADGISWDPNTIYKNVISNIESNKIYNYFVCEIKEDSVYRAWHSATSDHNLAYTDIYYSTSSDGINFTGQGKVLEREQDYESRNMNSPMVIYAQGAYHMYYEAVPAAGDPTQIAYARGVYDANGGLDEIKWTKHGVVIPTGTSGTFDSNATISPCVIFDNDHFEMFYNGYGNSGSKVGFAVSKDGLKWKKVGTVNSVNGSVIGVTKSNGTYGIWYYTLSPDWPTHKWRELHYATSSCLEEEMTISVELLEVMANGADEFTATFRLSVTDPGNSLTGGSLVVEGPIDTDTFILDQEFCQKLSDAIVCNFQNNSLFVESDYFLVDSVDFWEIIFTVTNGLNETISKTLLIPHP